MAVEFLVNRLKALLVLVLGAFKRAMCCLRRKRRSSCDSIPLSAVGVIPNLTNNCAVSDVIDIIFVTFSCFVKVIQSKCIY